MRAALLTAHGSTDNIQYRDDYPDPEYGRNEVLIRVGAASINYHDIFTRKGMPGINIPLPLITGSDIAGEVIETGEEVEGWKPGDRVLINPIIGREGKFTGMIGETVDGGKAEFVVAGDYQLIALPDAVSYEDASALPLAYGTAHRMMRTIGKVSEGEKVLILGASGGVGVCCVQLAKLAGATVIVCAGSEDKIQRLKDLGADHGINYHEKDFMKATWEIVGKPRVVGDGGVDVVVNYTGGDTWLPSLRCVNIGGRILTCGATAGFEAITDLRYVWTFEQQILGSNGWKPEDLESLLELGASGRMRPVISEVFSLEETARAEQLMEDRKIFGKILVKP
jgi:alcohol dehydrogenase